jgi:WD40 repeat protein
MTSLIRSVRCSHLSDGRSLQSLRAHTDVVTCLALTRDGATLVTGARDTTLMVWPLIPATSRSSSANLLPEKPRHVLHGHDDEVTCVVASSDVNIVLSGSSDGTAIVYTLRSGNYMRSLPHPASAPVDLLALSAVGTLVLYSRTDHILHALTINHRGQQPPLASTGAGERLHAIAFDSTNDVLISAGERGVVVLRRAHDLSVLHELRALSEESPTGPGPLRCLALSAGDEYVLAGSQRGTLFVWAVPSVPAERDNSVDAAFLAAAWDERVF